MKTTVKTAPKAATKTAPKAAKSPTVFGTSEYKGSKIANVFDRAKYNGEANDEANRPAVIVAFGLRKAKAILAHIDEIKAFVAENE